MSSQFKIFFIMGVSGSGKTTIGEMLAKKLSLAFYDGDDFHPQPNIKKMESGQPLTDEDRLPWLASINKFAASMSQQKSVIIACSALKEKYRDLLSRNINATFIYLKGAKELIYSRLEERKSHFMPSDLLDSQFATLEEPDDAITVDINQSPENILEQIISTVGMKKAFGVIGLGVMGKSLARNLARNGVELALFNRHVPGIEENIALDFVENFPELAAARGFDDLGLFVEALSKPRKIMLMVNAGAAVDSVLDLLFPYLDQGDIVIDGGNSHFKNTEERFKRFAEIGVEYIGTGVSGGEEGALKGPSIMPGGNPEAYKRVAPYLEKIAAINKDGSPCCARVGSGGSGHFVKMIHNGIEYAEMQLIAEIYGFLKNAQYKTNEEIADMFETWNKTDLNSYLLEITIDILRVKEGNIYILDTILDKAGNKGTGSWTTITASELGVAIPSITSALFARYQSAFKNTRVKASQLFKLQVQKSTLDTAIIQSGYRLARIINHHQGFHIISEASKKYEWNVNLSQLANIWMNGCIIRSELMGHLIPILKSSPEILLHEDAVQWVQSDVNALNKVCADAVLSNIPIPTLLASAAYLHTYYQGDGTANMIQAQRDYFGAHTYERIDDVSGEKIHTDWLKYK